MTTPTINQKVTQISAGAFIIASALMLAGFIFYSMAKRNISIEQTQSELKVHSVAQVDQVLPSFLLPEQMNGLQLLLDRYKEQEGLTDIKIVHSPEDVTSRFKGCLPLGMNVSSCTSEEGD